MSEVEDSKAKPDECEKTCRKLFEEYQKTGNPLFAWLATQTWLGRQCTPAQEGALMPEAMQNFLRDTSDTIMGLAVAVALTHGLTKTIRKAANQGTLTADDAMKVLPEALKLRRPGGSAFKDFARQVNADYWVDKKAVMQRAGASEGEAIETIGRITSISDERSVRGILKGGRIRQQKRRPSNKTDHGKN